MKQLVTKQLIHSLTPNKKGGKHIYAFAKAHVRIISTHDEVLILENLDTGMKFSCNKNEVEEVEIEEKIIEEIKELELVIPIEKYTKLEYDKPFVSDVSLKIEQKKKQEKLKPKQAKLF